MNPRTERLLEAQAETARTINRLMLTLLGLGLASTLTVGFPDSYLLTTATTVSIPFAGAASFKALLILGPVLLICLRVYLEIYVAHWRRLDGLLRRSPSARVRRLPIASPFRHPLLRLFSGFILYALVPLVLGIFTYEAMVFRQWGVGLLYLTVASTLVLVCHRFSWAWPYRFVAPPLALLAIIVMAEIGGGLDGFRRPFELQLANLERSILSNEDLRSADLRGAKLNEADLVGAQLEGADLRRAQLKGANLNGAQLEDADLFQAQLNRADLYEAQLEGADLRWAQLERADLRRAQLKGADLSGAQLEGADLTAAQLEGADLREAQLEDAIGLTQPQLDGACGNEGTQLPAGLTVPDCPASP